MAKTMTFIDRIDQDLKQAMRDRQADKLSVLRMLKSALKYGAIEKLGQDGKLDDADAMLVVRKQVKQRQDAIEGFEKGGRPELAEKERIEMAILNTYLPQPLSSDEIAALVEGAIAEVNATSKAQMGAVMKLVQERAAGRADGKTLSQMVQSKLK